MDDFKAIYRRMIEGKQCYLCGGMGHNASECKWRTK